MRSDVAEAGLGIAPFGGAKALAVRAGSRCREPDRPVRCASARHGEGRVVVRVRPVEACERARGRFVLTTNTDIFAELSTLRLTLPNRNCSTMLLVPW